MNDQLRRIKSKDYSKIDQTLFENMVRTDNLSRQFQRFLMQQITQLNTQPEKGNQSLKCSINKNFETLRDSLVQCSRMQEETNTAKALKKKLADVEDSFGKMKEEIQEEIKRVHLQTKKGVEGTVYELVRALEKERLENQNLLGKIQHLTKEREMFQQQIQELKQRTNDDKIDSFRSFTPLKKEKKNESNHQSATLQRTETILVQYEQREIKPLRDKLKNYGANGLNSIPSFSDQNWKIRREQIIKNDIGLEPKRYSLSRQTSNHRLSSKENIIFSKQNQALMSKGVRQERRKSKQKIKIFSLI